MSIPPSLHHIVNTKINAHHAVSSHRQNHQQFQIGDRVQVKDHHTSHFNSSDRFGLGVVTGFSVHLNRSGYKIPLVQPDGWHVSTTFDEVVAVSDSSVIAIEKAHNFRDAHDPVMIARRKSSIPNDDPNALNNSLGRNSTGFIAGGNGFVIADQEAFEAHEDYMESRQDNLAYNPNDEFSMYERGFITTGDPEYERQRIAEQLAAQRTFAQIELSASGLTPQRKADMMNAANYAGVMDEGHFIKENPLSRRIQHEKFRDVNFGLVPEMRHDIVSDFNRKYAPDREDSDPGILDAIGGMEFDVSTARLLDNGMMSPRERSRKRNELHSMIFPSSGASSSSSSAGGHNLENFC